MCQADMSSKTSSQARSYILNLPPVLQTAVKADSLPSLTNYDAVELLVKQTVARRQQSFAESVMRPPLASSPLECRIYEEVGVDQIMLDESHR